MKVLPEPGVDVFITYAGQRSIARLETGKAYFVTAKFDANRWSGKTRTIPASHVESWDYAVPAGDML